MRESFTGVNAISTRSIRRVRFPPRARHVPVVHWLERRVLSAQNRDRYSIGIRHETNDMPVRRDLRPGATNLGEVARLHSLVRYAADVTGSRLGLQSRRETGSTPSRCATPVHAGHRRGPYPRSRRFDPVNWDDDVETHKDERPSARSSHFGTSCCSTKGRSPDQIGRSGFDSQAARHYEGRSRSGSRGSDPRTAECNSLAFDYAVYRNNTSAEVPG